MDRFSSLADEDTSAMGRGMPRPYILSAPMVWASSSVYEVTPAMESKVLYGRGMPRPISMPFFFGG